MTDREKWDIDKIAGNKDYFYFLPEHRRTAAVSMAAVTACWSNLEYVPEAAINKDICRAAILSKDADCIILSQIPFPSVQKEAIQRFKDVPAFVLYSFVDIRDTEMAHDAVGKDAYCLQLVPDKLITADLCKTALQHPNADKNVLESVPQRFHHNPEIRKIIGEKFGSSPMQKETSPSPKKKGLSV